MRYTRAMVTAALSGELEQADFVTDPHFGVQVPTSCPGVPSEILIPANTWDDKAAYEESARKLCQMFQQNFDEKYAHMPEEIITAGPKA